MNRKVDRVIIGAGMYGLYAARHCGKRGDSVIVLEYDREAVSRATYINQARVHNGYHYPRSFSTAIKSARYFSRFNRDFGFAINNRFDKVYATSREYSLTSSEQFKKFCENANIRCEEINPGRYFKEGMVDGAFVTEEYTFDAMIIRDYYLKEIAQCPKVEILYNARIKEILRKDREYSITMENGDVLTTEFVLNATYASTNQISKRAGFDTLKIKYEICEIIICSTTDNLRNAGITVMDGPFFSVMPFGLTGEHSLTSVTFTPHTTSYSELPGFRCQENNFSGWESSEPCSTDKATFCSPEQLNNCNLCSRKPHTAWNYMYALARKYLREDIELYYKNSMFSVKPILMASEIDDSRPTVIRQLSSNPTFISILSGKINTVYDLEEVL